MKNQNNVTLIPATIDDYPTIQNMARFYVYDMSEYCGDLEEWEMPADGLYECLDLKGYFEEGNTYPFLIRQNEELVGFVIIDKKGSDAGIDYNVAQFFVLRKFKGKGIGRYVAHTCFDKFQGIWEVMVLPGNIGAMNFWMRVITDYTNSDFIEYTRTVPHLENCLQDIFKFKSK